MPYHTVTVPVHGTSREQVLLLILTSRQPSVLNALVPVKYLQVLTLPIRLLFINKVLGRVIT